MHQGLGANLDTLEIIRCLLGGAAALAALVLLFLSAMFLHEDDRKDI